MTAFGLSICLIVIARKGLKSLPTMLEESNETIFQMKDAIYFSFKELQLNMDYIFCIAIRSNITLHSFNFIYTFIYTFIHLFIHILYLFVSILFRFPVI